MSRMSSIVSHLMPATPLAAGRERSPAPEAGEPTLAVISTFAQGNVPGAAASHGELQPGLLPGALWGLLREQGLRTSVHGCDEVLQMGAARCRGVILCGDSPLSVAPALLRLRQHPDTALLPLIVYLLRDGLPGAAPEVELLPQGWARYADAVVESDAGPAEAAAALQRLRRVSAALGALPAPLTTAPRSQRRLLLLRMLLTRGLVSLSPQRDPSSPLCHSYPPLDLLSEGLLHNDLDALVQLGLLERSFFERVCVCQSCGDARLLFREVCGACLSADVRRGEVIHHYRCGHVAPELSFHRGAELACPSCGESLRHIGIDYERPAALLHCHNCDHLASEGVTQARCLGCGQTQTADAVAERVLWTYLLTPEGRAAATSGQLPAAGAAVEAPREDGEAP